MAASSEVNRNNSALRFAALKAKHPQPWSPNSCCMSGLQAPLCLLCTSARRLPLWKVASGKQT